MVFALFLASLVTLELITKQTLKINQIQRKQPSASPQTRGTALPPVPPCADTQEALTSTTTGLLALLNAVEQESTLDNHQETVQPAETKPLVK